VTNNVVKHISTPVEPAEDFRSLLSQVLDGAAFPAMMLAVAVSQIEAVPETKDDLRQDKRLAAELQMGDRVKQEAYAAPRNAHAPIQRHPQWRILTNKNASQQ
jgi:hypothetical protein